MQYTIKQKPEQGGSARPGKRLEDSTMDYNNYDRGYAEPSMNASDYMTRTYRWMASGLLITFAMAYITATTSLIYLVDSLYLVLTIAELALVFVLSSRVQNMSVDAARATFFGYALLNGMVLSYYFIVFSVGTLVMAFLATAVYFGLMAVYGTTTHKDLTGWGPRLMMGLVALIVTSLIGMLFGYAVALCFGMVSFADVGNAAWFALPEPLHFGLKFDPASCVAIGLLFAINSIQAIGDFTATTVGGLDRDPTDQELQGGIIAYGTSNILTALMGGLPTATYSQNVGIVTTNKVVNRTVFAIAGGFLLLAGISPKFAALLTTIPQCVLGGATVTVFSTIAMTGMKLIASQDLTARNTTIVGLSAALGVGISQASEALSQFPEAFTMVFGQSPVVIATIMAVLLNLILPKEK